MFSKILNWLEIVGNSKEFDTDWLIDWFTIKLTAASKEANVNHVPMTSLLQVWKGALAANGKKNRN